MNNNTVENQALLNTIKSLQNEISTSKSFLNVLFNTIPNPIFYKDKNCIYQHCNDAFSQTILGIPKEKIIGKSLYDIPEVIPKKFADIYNTKDKELMDNPGLQNYESKVKCADGVVRDYHFYKTTFLSETKEVLGIVGVMLDISTYKQSIEELNEKNEILHELSSRDSLTKLYNRRFLKNIFKRKSSLLVHHHQPFAFLLVDIDFFKDYNDLFGHPKGDEALKEIAKAMKSTFSRTTDYTFRLGGEEFGVLFNFNTKKEALHLVEKLLSQVENLKIPAANKKVSQYITISAGLSLIISQNDEEVAFDHIYEQTDNLLYNAKNNGRHQIKYKQI